MGAIVVPATTSILPAQSANGARPQFEVASVKACKGAPLSVGQGQKGAGSAGAPSSPVTYTLPCMPVRFLITLAYGISNSQPTTVGLKPALEGGPTWIDSDRYQIRAKADSAVTKDVMNGPMLRALLEERFHLRIHSEKREVSAYALTVAGSGIKMRPWDGTSCNLRDLSQPSLPPGDKPWCGLPKGTKGAHLIKTDLPGATMAQFAQALGLSGRVVIDKTGIAEKFDFHLEYAPDGTDLSDELAAPSLDFVLGKLGLRLARTKATGEILIIDNVEKPTEN